MNAQVNENEDVSVCSRYTKYPQWDSVLETEFLDNLVSCYPNTSGLDLELYFERDLEDGGHKILPLLQTPTWSLSLLEGDNLSPVKPVIIPIVQSSSKKKRRRSGHSIQRTQHNSLKKSKSVKTSYYYNHDDWSELNLMQGLSGEKIGDQYSSTDSSSDESFDNAHVEETDENQHRNTAGEERLEQPIQGVERIRERDPTNHRAGDVALVPLIAGQTGGHVQVAIENGMETVDTLAAATIHLVRHGGATHLPFGKSFTGQFVTSH